LRAAFDELTVSSNLNFNITKYIVYMICALKVVATA
jgi:hypothetical protein